jgi:hypothetical protein
MKIIYDSYREERIYHAVATAWNWVWALAALGFAFSSTADGFPVWQYGIAMFFTLIGAVNAQKFAKVNKEKYGNNNRQREPGQPPDE